MKEFLHLFYLKGRQLLIADTKNNLDKLKRLRILLYDFTIPAEAVPDAIKSFLDMGDVDNIKVAMEDGKFLGIASVIFKHDVSVNAAVEKFQAQN